MNKKINELYQKVNKNNEKKPKWRKRWIKNIF